MIRTRKTFVIVAVVGSLLFGATAAFAQETPADTPQAARQADGPAKSRFGAFVLRQTMAFLDVTQGEVVSTLARGGTLAQLAEEQGSSGDELAAALLAVVDRHLQHAVATGRITEDQAAEHLARAEGRIARTSNHTIPRIVATVNAAQRAACWRR